MQKTKRPVSMSEVLAWAMRVCREKHDLNRKAERAVISGKRTTPATRARGPIPARIKHGVRYREEGRCPGTTPFFSLSVGVPAEEPAAAAFPALPELFCFPQPINTMTSDAV